MQTLATTSGRRIPPFAGSKSRRARAWARRRALRHLRTQGNLVSVLTQTRPGQEIILDADSHIFNYEVGGVAVFGGIQTLPVKTKRGFLRRIRCVSTFAPATFTSR
jgi:hypothetical protein